MNHRATAERQPDRARPLVPADPLTTAIRAAVRAELDGLRDELVEALTERQSPQLLDGPALAVALNVSAPIIRKLVDQGCPHVVVGTVRRFDLARVTAWLESRPKP